MKFDENLDSFFSSQEEEVSGISYSTLQRQKWNAEVKVWIKNLPSGINEQGLKNLFLTVGKPLYIYFKPDNRSASVYFKSIKEAELAVRDLHQKPPYQLKVVIEKLQTGTEKKKQDASKTDFSWDFSNEPIEDNVMEESTIDQSEAEIPSGKNLTSITDQVVVDTKSNGTSPSYDPSLRMRQRELDIKTDSDCISMGRGYMFMGMDDRFVGGLQKFESASKNSKAQNKMNFLCKNCNALTTKFCWTCKVPFCSEICLYKSSSDHQKSCLSERNSEEKTSLGKDYLNLSVDKQKVSTVSSDNFVIPLQTGCTVIISTYLSMNTVFVRRSDEIWEEKFVRLCNDVASEVFKGGKFKDKSKVGDLVIGKYYHDLCFYRAKICSKTEKKVTLFFIDFGNIQETNFEDVKPLPNYLKLVPGLAVKVELKDVPEGSSLNSVNYLNNLTAKRVPLILNLDDSSDKVVLTEKDSKEVVNETVCKFLLPSWKKDASAYSKSGEIIYLKSIKQQKLEIGKTLNLILAHFDEKEFLDSEVFWVINPETDDFFHVKTEMYHKVKEYCEFLKNDYYLPRPNEVCLAKENGEWHRCVNLKSHNTTCCLFFIDDGHSSLIETNKIRKMIQDFIEAPSQVVCCTLPSYAKLKENEEIKSRVVQYLKESIGQTMKSVSVVKLMGDAYCLSVPEIVKILAEFETDT